MLGQTQGIPRAVRLKVSMTTSPGALLVSAALNWQLPGRTVPSVEPKRPLPVQRVQCPELQRHGVGAGVRRVVVLQRVVVVVLHGLTARVQREGPEAVQVDLLAEARGHGVHQQAGGGPLDLHVVGQPVSADTDTGHTERLVGLKTL